MPRPSLKETRSQEILDAFTRCVARYGLDGSTLERISTEAGVGRPLLRHYLGNRDQMVDQLITHVSQTFEAVTAELFDGLPKHDRLEPLLEALFGDRTYSAENAAVFQALVAASERYTDLRAPLLEFVHGFENRIAQEIKAANPGVDATTCETAASAITAIYFNIAAIAPLDPKPGWILMQRRAVEGILKNL